MFRTGYAETANAYLTGMEFERILVRATNWVGDAVMSIPALQALREEFSAAHIAILAKPWVADLYGREPFCDEIIEFDASSGVRGLVERARMARNLRKRAFQLAVVLPNSFDSAAVTWAAGIPTRIGFARDGRSWLLTDAIPIPEQGQIPSHQRFYYLELLKRSGLIRAYPLDVGIRLSGAMAAAEKGHERFRELSVSEPVVGVSPGAAFGGAKRWLPERFAHAAVKLAIECDGTVAVFGSKQEQDVCARVWQAVQSAGVRCIDLSGRTSLGAFIEMAAACDLYLTNDSGPMHIASALGVPTVIVFGPTEERETGPTGDRFRIVREPVECSPCLLRECPIDHRCMTRVSTERVVEAGLALRTAVHK